MKKNWIVGLLAIILLALVIFFYPKTNNIWADSFTARTSQYKNMDCTCLGFEMSKQGLTRSEIIENLCYGLPINCEYSCMKMIDGNWTEILCDQLEVGK